MNLEDNGKETITITMAIGESVKIISGFNGSEIRLLNTAQGLVIDGNAKAISKITGKGILGKVEIPPTLDSTDIIRKCDEWIKNFNTIHDFFKELVLSDKYKKKNVTMELSFDVLDPNTDLTEKKNTITLDLKQGAFTMFEGPAINLGNEDREIFNYLVGNVLSYYLQKNLAGKEVILRNGCFAGEIFSKEKPGISISAPIKANIEELAKNEETKDLVGSLISCNNSGTSDERVLEKLRQKIIAQQLPEEIAVGIDNSANVLESWKKM